MKAILISIRPKWVAKILNGEKTIEIRKRFPLNYRGWVYIYCTKSDKGLVWDSEGKGLVNSKLFPYDKDDPEHHRLVNGKVVARFYCDKITSIGWCERYIGFERTGEIYRCSNIGVNLLTKSCLSSKEINDYLGTDINKIKEGYAIHISQLEIFGKPKELSEFWRASCEKCPIKNSKACFNHCGEDICKITKAPQSWQYVEVIYDL